MEKTKMRGFKKRILASALAVAMIVSSVSVTGITASAAEQSDFILGADYVITSKSSGKVLAVEGNSTEEGAKIVQMTPNNSEAQVWTVTDGGDGYYNLVNKVSGKAIDVPNSSTKQGTELKQYNNGSNRNYQKFAITDTGDGYYRITPKQVSNFAIRVKDNSKEDGATIVQWEYEGTDSEKWSFKLVKPSYAISDYDAVAREAYDSWLAKFFYIDEKGYGRLNNMNGFWTEAEVLEMFVDAYEHFGDEKYLIAAEQLYEGLMDKRDVNWEWNGYTDDTMYMTIACVRLYLVTNDPRHLNTAKRNFDLVYARAVQEDGTVIWCMDEDKQYKNACANCPTMIAAVYLGNATGDTSYYDKAIKIWDWVYPNLFEEQYKKTGGYDDTGIQGIFIGSSALLYSVTGDQKYKDAAIRGCEVAKSIGKGANDILDGEGVKGGDYNSVAAKGILARWIGYFTELCPDVNQFDYWMEINADSAWAHRNSDNLMWGHFGTQTKEGVENDEEYYESGDNVQKKRYASWACSAAVSWLINCTGRPIVGNASAYTTGIEAENATITGGARVVNASDCSNGKYVGNVGVEDGSVQFTFKSEDDGEALLSLYYASGQARKFRVTVNDKTSYIVDCPSTGSWNKPGNPVCVSVDFVKGDNKVVISGVDGNPAPNLDYVGVNLPDYVEMEDGFQDHGARDASHENCSGGKDMEWIGGEKGGSVAFTIPAEAAGKAKLAFTYATNGDRKVNIIVNGESHSLDCASTKNWTVFAEEPLTLDIDLQKGFNEIIFTGVDGATAPNLDWFMIEWLYNKASQEQVVFNGENIVYEAEDAALKNNAKVTDKNIASNGKKVGDLGGADNGTCTFTFYSAVEGNANVDVYYITNGQRSFYVTANTSPALELPCEGNSWNEIRKVTMSVDLKVGENTLKFDNGTGNYAPDLDKIEVSLLEGNGEVPEPDDETPDDEAPDGDTPSDDNNAEKLRAFVERMYTVALGRAGESGGIEYWTNMLLTYKNDGAGIAQGFLLSSEFKNKNYSDEEYIKVLYKTFFNREAETDPDGFAYWKGILSAGNSRECVLAGFVNSNEFDALCTEYGISRGFMRQDGTTINVGIVRFAERLYTKVLERAGEKDGMEYWSIKIADGECTPEDAAKSFFMSEEYLKKQTDDAQYLGALYRTFMDREPEVNGMAYWLEMLENGTSRETVLSEFARSEEFKRIMVEYGL